MSKSVGTPAESGSPATSSRRGWKALKYGFLILFLVVGALVVNRIIFLNRLWADCEILLQNGYPTYLYSGYKVDVQPIDDCLRNWLPTEIIFDRVSNEKIVSLPAACNAPLTRLSGLIARFDHQNTVIDDQQAAIFGRMKQLKMLEVDGSDLTDAGLMQLLKARSLRALFLYQCRKITDDGLEGIERLQALEGLTIEESQISDRGAALIGQCTAIERLDLRGCRITPAGFTELAKLKNLWLLGLSGNGILDDSIAPHIRSLTSLRYFYLNRTRVGENSCRAIATLPEMEAVYLMNCPVTLDGLRAFRHRDDIVVVVSPEQKVQFEPQLGEQKIYSPQLDK